MTTDATVAQLLHRAVSARLRVSVALPAEVKAVMVVLGIALAFRLVDLFQIEPNLLPDEADHLSTIYRILAGRGPGPFDLSWDGNPAFSLYPTIPLVWLTDGGVSGLRVSVALASVLMLAAFYVAVRRHCSPGASLAATLLLGFSQWALFFSRNGEVNVFVALYEVLAIGAAHRALDTGAKRYWALAGFWAGLGWYGFLAGVLILPILLLAIPVWRSDAGGSPSRAAARLALLLGVFALTVAPRVPGIVSGWSEVDTYIRGRAITERVSRDQLPAALLRQTVTTVQAFFLFDPTHEGNPRYLARGRAVLDWASATLFVAGLALALRHSRRYVLWLAALILPIASTQILTVRTPDLARAILARPAYFFFVALACERVGLLVAKRPLLQGAAAVAVIAVCWSNWQAYATWARSAASAAARQPAVDYDEFAAWRATQLELAAEGEPGLTVTAWRDLHPRTKRGPIQTTPASSAPVGPLSTTQVAALSAGSGQQAPRGVAVAGDGRVFVVGAGGGIQSMQPGGTAFSRASTPARLAGGQFWDLAVDQRGTLYLLDAERGAVAKVSPDGEVLGLLGLEWGMYHPRGLTIAPNGLLYIADTGRNRVLIASTEGNLVGEIGSTSERGDLEQPTDVVVTADGDIVVALPELGRLERLDASGRPAGGWPISKGNTIDSPRLALTGDGALVVSEPQARRVRLFDEAGGLLGQIDAGLTLPFGLAVDDVRLYVSDPPTGRVLVFDLHEP